jgi:hypothetical protein
MAVATAKPSPLKVFQVSARDRDIFEAVQVNCRSQRAVAVEFKLSQARVSAIVKRVMQWLGQGAPPGFDELPRAARLRAVSRLHRMRLERLLREANEAWQKSDSTTHAIVEKVAKGEVVNRTTKVQTRNRDLRQTRYIADLEDRIAAFEGFDERGNVDESSQGRVHEEPERTPVEDCREVKRRLMLGGFDTPGDEGIPGLWGAEMEQRNAEVRKQNAEVRKQNAEVGNAECGLGNEGVPNAEVARIRDDVDERQRGVTSLAPVLRGDGRGEGPAVREDLATDLRPRNAEAHANDQPPRRLDAIPDGALLSPNVATSAQYPQQQPLTSAGNQQIVLSKSEPKPKRYRLMGTAVEMAVSKNYDEFFSFEERIYRATEKARAAQEVRARASANAMAGQTPHQPLTPALSPEYRGEGAGNAQPVSPISPRSTGARDCDSLKG